MSPRCAGYETRNKWGMMHNGRDVTAQKTIEWGNIEERENGNCSIRYQCLAMIWDRNRMIMNRVFTFKPDGTFVAVTDASIEDR